MNWVARVPRDRSNALAGLRALELEGACDSEYFWVRGTQLTQELQQALRCVEGLESFLLTDGGWLVRHGGHVGRGRLPALRWEPLRALIRPRLPLSPVPGIQETKVEVRLVRDDFERPCSALLLPLEAWVAWCLRAPLVRLERLEFAAAADGRVFVRGSPLPPLAGSPYVESEGVALPAGWRLEPELALSRVASRFGLASGDVALFHASGWEHIPATAFVRASRAAARASAPEHARD